MRPDAKPASPGTELPARPRRVHRTDWMALLCGLLFIGVGITYMAAPAADAVVMTPVVVGGLGFAAFVAIIAKAIRR
ncbi:hypothetical protein [Planotetraspora mira]|uniref:Uncharacterized protein n=1 Tax=Planotetraspora mira TaxID=58121 RepID=A0A8J3X6R4_9ACTN|nr:hypothetical protein [Planotetraspora mira]GII29526.1 hypothetical protein Pmi06nite_29680 [Planotetraspora mira]